MKSLVRQIALHSAFVLMIGAASTLVLRPSSVLAGDAPARWRPLDIDADESGSASLSLQTKRAPPAAAGRRERSHTQKGVGDTAAEPLDREGPAPQKTVGVVNLNTASAAELILLPGVGDAKASRIVAYRTRRGAFRRIRDLRRVKGFGYKSVKKLRPYLTLDGETTLGSR